MIFWESQDTRDLQISTLLSLIAIGQPMAIVNLPPIGDDHLLVVNRTQAMPNRDKIDRGVYKGSGFRDYL